VARQVLVKERRIFFPWERRGGILRRLGLHRLRPVLLASTIVAFFVWIGARERSAAGVRRTRALMHRVSEAMDAYLADHDGKCPEAFADLGVYGNVPAVPKDAWGTPLTMMCPDPRGDLPYRLTSDGPDRIPGGLDRLE
jgi:hypothetical protein